MSEWEKAAREICIPVYNRTNKLLAERFMRRNSSCTGPLRTFPVIALWLVVDVPTLVTKASLFLFQKVKWYKDVMILDESGRLLMETRGSRHCNKDNLYGLKKSNLKPFSYLSSPRSTHHQERPALRLWQLLLRGGQQVGTVTEAH